MSLEYTGEDNAQHQPVMIHRAPFGSLERFVALLLEHTKGHLPLWLAPVQVSVLSISEHCNPWAQEVYQTLLDEDIRVEIDLRNEKLGKKIREAELKKVPHMLIIGEKECAHKQVSHREKAQGQHMSQAESQSSVTPLRGSHRVPAMRPQRTGSLKSFILYINDQLGLHKKNQILHTPTAEDYLASGIAHIKQTHLTEALVDFDHAIKLNAKYAEAYYCRAYVYDCLDHHKEAQKDRVQAKKIDPTCPYVELLSSSVNKQTSTT